MKTPIKQGARDKFFLLDTVRHISRYLDFGNKKGRAISDPLLQLFLLIQN
jgi:hypothetical protein